MPCPPHSSWLHHTSNIGWGVQIMQLLSVNYLQSWYLITQANFWNEGYLTSHLIKYLCSQLEKLLLFRLQKKKKVTMKYFLIALWRCLIQQKPDIFLFSCRQEPRYRIVLGLLTSVTMEYGRGNLLLRGGEWRHFGLRLQPIACMTPIHDCLSLTVQLSLCHSDCSSS